MVVRPREVYRASLDDEVGGDSGVDSDEAGYDSALIRGFGDYVHHNGGMYNKFGVQGDCPVDSRWHRERRLRNIRTGYPASRGWKVMLHVRVRARWSRTWKCRTSRSIRSTM